MNVLKVISMSFQKLLFILVNFLSVINWLPYLKHLRIIGYLLRIFVKYLFGVVSIRRNHVSLSELIKLSRSIILSPPLS